MASVSEPSYSLKRRGLFGANFADRIFRWGTFFFAIAVPILILLLVWILSKGARTSIVTFGGHFLSTSIWDVVHSKFGVLFAIAGTALTSLLALLLAVPVSLGAALFLSELAPRWMRSPLSFLIELLAAVPSIVYGIWGIFILVPVIKHVEVWLQIRFPFIPFFQGETLGFGVITAGVILAIMILPFITSISREVIQAVPRAQREAALALGATQWEALSGPVLRYARSGILGAIILGLGRALGETMAVTMVIGNNNTIPLSLFSLGNTMPSLLANEFAEASDPLQLSALYHVALVLVIITIIINAVARLMIWSVSKGERLEVQE